MDLDAFVSRHAAEWQRLEQLSRRRRLSGNEADELVLLYRRAATHLSLVQSRTPDPVTAARLSGLLARARAATVGGARQRGWAALGHGITVDFPVAVYLAWRWWCAVATTSTIVSFAMMFYLRDHPERISRVLSSSAVRQLVDHDFSDYYSAHPAQSFAAQVWTNNALVAAECMFLGITIVGTLYFLFQNVLGVGVVGGAMLGAGKAGVFWGLILPHGLLELTAVFVSGVIEAFVTPSGLPTAARIGIGVLAEAGFLAYVIVLGRRGVRLGHTGDLAWDERESVAPVA